MLPRDFGPIYKETNSNSLIVEPWNTFSNFAFLIIFVYFSIKVYKNFKNHKFLAFSLPLMLIGFVGGTIYHATRSSNIWLFMDWIPIAILSLLVSIHFLIKQKVHWSVILVFIMLPFLYRFLFVALKIPKIFERFLGYPILALIIALPIIRWLILTRWSNRYLILLSSIFFVLALFFRTIDLNQNIFKMGTHWLWHIFGALATFCLAQYIYLDDNVTYKPQNKK